MRERNRDREGNRESQPEVAANGHLDGCSCDVLLVSRTAEEPEVFHCSEQG
jgi:hypothetical protein